MSKKNKETGLSKRSITFICMLFVIAICIVGLTIFIGLNGNTIFTNRTMTIERLQENASRAINQYEYALLTLDVQETVANQGISTYKYVLSSRQNSQEHSYAYVELNKFELYQYWDFDPETSMYKIYVYDPDGNCWVETFYEFEPVSSNTWELVTNLSNYTLLEEPGFWYDSGEECYVLEIIGSSDEFPVMYEELYIRKSDYVPLGILSYAVSDVDYDRLRQGVTPELYEYYGLTGDLTTSIPTYNEYVRVYKVAFSNEDLKLFGAPADYLTEEQYLRGLAGGPIDVE